MVSNSEGLHGLGRNEAPMRVTPIDLSFATVHGTERAIGEPYETMSFLPTGVRSEKRRLPTTSRRPRALTALPFARHTWLFEGTKTAGTAQNIRGVVVDLSGEQVGHFAADDVRLPAHALTSDALVSHEKNGRLRVLTETGHEISQWSSLKSPSLVAAHRPAARHLPLWQTSRSVTASVQHDLLLASVLDHVFIYRLSTGAQVASYRLPGYFLKRSAFHSEEAEARMQSRERESARAVPNLLASLGLPEDATPRQIASAVDASGVIGRALTLGGSIRVVGKRKAPTSAFDELDDIHYGLQLDWVELVQLSRDATALWVSSKSGLILRFNLAGFVEHAWVLPNAATSIVEAEWGTWGIAGRDLFYLSPNEAPEVFGIGDHQPRVLSADHAYGRMLSDFRLIKMGTKELGIFEQKGAARAIYFAADEMRVETPTSLVTART